MKSSYPVRTQRHASPTKNVLIAFVLSATVYSFNTTIDATRLSSLACHPQTKQSYGQTLTIDFQTSQTPGYSNFSVGGKPLSNTIYNQTLFSRQEPEAYWCRTTRARASFDKT